jgi:hypothetical protein
MKLFIRALGLALAVLLVCTSIIVAQAPPENPKFALAISTDKAQITKGEDVVIVIKMSNLSEDAIPYNFGYHGRMPDGYQFEIRDEQGNEVLRFGPRYKQMPNGKLFRLPDRPAGSSRTAEIAPGKSEEDRATISDDYPFDRPGTYSIRVWKPGRTDSSQSSDSARVYSNTITVTVLPAGGTPPGV